MILTNKLKLKKPECSESCDIDDLNYNMDKIDSDIAVLKEHSKITVCSEEGAHGMRYIEDDLQVLGAEGWYSLTNETEYIAPADLQAFEVVAGDTQVSIKFLEPEDVVQKGITVCKVAGVMIRYSTEKYPENITEGTLAIDNKDLGKYKDEAFELKGLENKTKYYFSAFVYSTKNLYNLNAGRMTCTPTGRGKLIVNSPRDAKFKLSVDGVETEVSISANEPFISLYVRDTKIIVTPEKAEGRMLAEGGGEFTIVGDETTTVNLVFTEIPETLNACSWALIKKLSDARRIKEFFNIGDKKEVFQENTYKLARADTNGTRFICLAGCRSHITEYREPYNYTPKVGEIIRIRRIELSYKNYPQDYYTEPDNNTDPTKFISYQLGYEVKNSPSLRTRGYGFNLEDNVEDFLGELPDTAENRRIYCDGDLFTIVTNCGVKNTDGQAQIFAEGLSTSGRYYKEGEKGAFSAHYAFPSHFTWVLDL